MNSTATGVPSKRSKLGGTLRTECTCASPVMTIGFEGFCSHEVEHALPVRDVAVPVVRPNPLMVESASWSSGAKRTWLASTFQRAVELSRPSSQPRALLGAEDRALRVEGRRAVAELPLGTGHGVVDLIGAVLARVEHVEQHEVAPAAAAVHRHVLIDRLARARERAVLPVREVRRRAALPDGFERLVRVQVEVGVVVRELVVVPGHHPRVRLVGGLERLVRLVLGVPRAVLRERPHGAGRRVRAGPGGRPGPS